MARGGDEARSSWLAGLLAIWCIVALAVATWQAATTRPDPDPSVYPSRWTLGGAAVEPLRELLGRVERRLPEGATVVIDSYAIKGSEQILLLAWCRYLLPRQHVQLGGVGPSPAASPLSRAVPQYRLIVPAAPADVTHPPNQTVLLHEAPATLLRLEPEGGAP